MLRWAVVLLVMANAAYFAWTQGYLDGLGWAPVEQREPQRMAEQVKQDMRNAWKLSTILQRSVLTNCWKSFGKHMTLLP